MGERTGQLVVLTFDDGVNNHLSFVAPLLRKMEFGATFFVTDDPHYQGSEHYLTWNKAGELADLGFEIGNHLGKHIEVTELGAEKLRELIRQVEARCLEHGIPKPVSFCYPSYSCDVSAVSTLAAMGYRFARRGVAPEYYSDYGDRGPFFEPGVDHPLLIPTTIASGPAVLFEDFAEVLDQASGEEIVVLTYHGVPDLEHHWVHTSEEDFIRQMRLLEERGCRVLGLRDLQNLMHSTALEPADKADFARLKTSPLPSNLRCEYLENPLGIDIPHPRFSWSFETRRRDFQQRGFRLIVSSTKANATSGIGDMWDSGRVISSKCRNVEYAGKPLESFKKYWWTVIVWDRDDVQVENAESSWFEMAIVEPETWRGHWIGPGIPHLSTRFGDEITDVLWSPLLRKEISLDGTVKTARAYICGLGWHELYVNGQKVGQAVLDPAPTDYHKSVLYRTHDITSLLLNGENVLGIILGNGWYSEPRWRYAYGECPRALLYIRIEAEDGTIEEIVSDETWSVASGPILENQFWGGEVYDARLEKTGWLEPGYDQSRLEVTVSTRWHLNRGSTDYLDGKWRKAVITDRPEGIMKSQLIPEMRVNEEPELVRLTELARKKWLCEMGEFYGGWIRLKVKGVAGTKVKIRYSGRLGEDGQITQGRQQGGSTSTDTYILKGDPSGEVYEPRFSYHPVKYVQIEGDIESLTPEDITGRKIYSTIDLSGGFACSNPLLNKIHQAVRRTMTNQLFGIPLDCLYREHWGWTDPATITGTLFPRLYMPLFWHKWLCDFKEAQRANGSVPDFAPDYLRSHGVDPAWGGNYPLLVWYLYQYFGDISFLQNHYQGLKKQVRYFQAAEREGLLVEGHFGDHMLPGSSPGEDEFISTDTPRELVWSGYYYRGVRCVAGIAEVLGLHNDAQEFSELAERIKDAFNAKWYEPEADCYSSGSQTANFIALSLGIVPEGKRAIVLESTVNDINDRYHGHHHTGNTGTTCMIETLNAEGFGHVMYDMLNKTDYPGWGYMIASGSTTIWESWSGPDGQVGDADSMSMWATIDKFFHNDLAGIKGPGYYRDSEIKPGFRQLEIAPFIPDDLVWAQDQLKTAYGMVVSRWEKADEGLIVLVQIPAGCNATLTVPVIPSSELTIVEGAVIVWRHGKMIGPHPGVNSMRIDTDNVEIECSCGRYRFLFNTDPAMLTTRVHDI